MQVQKKLLIDMITNEIRPNGALYSYMCLDDDPVKREAIFFFLIMTLCLNN